MNFKEQRELRFASFINITERWLVQSAIRYDEISKKSLNNRISLVYIDDCISFEIGFRRKFSEYRDLKPSNSFMIKFNVFTEDAYSKYSELLTKKAAIVQSFRKGMNAKAVVKALTRVNKEIKEIEKNISI